MSGRSSVQNFSDTCSDLAKKKWIFKRSTDLSHPSYFSIFPLVKNWPFLITQCNLIFFYFLSSSQQIGDIFWHFVIFCAQCQVISSNFDVFWCYVIWQFDRAQSKVLKLGHGPLVWTLHDQKSRRPKFMLAKDLDQNKILSFPNPAGPWVLSTFCISTF